MSRAISIIMIQILVSAFYASGIVRQVVKVPLEYNYLPGEPFWAKYGSIDQRSIELWIGASPKADLGSFIIDDMYNFVIVPGGAMQEYLDKAVCSVLSHYGINIQKRGMYHLVITPDFINFSAADDDEDEEKQCIVRLWVEYFGPDSTRLFCALVGNEGIMDVDDDDDLQYAGLLDRTLHGAIVKIWGSQVLFTDKPLGNGVIRKIDRGTYAFVPDSTLFKPADSLFLPGSPSCRRSTYGLSAIGRADYSMTADPAGQEPGRSVISGATGEDSVVVVGGRRISVGILPFENGPGSERLTALVKSAQERFSSTLSRSGTIKLMERGRLSDILREQALGLSGIMNDSTVVRVGNISGLQVMIAGGITTSGSCYRMHARIINVETSAIVASSSILVSDALRISEAGEELAAHLLYKFTEEKLEVNRNTMPYPSIVPRAEPAVTAATEDAWAVEHNPASIMKVSQRDAAFYTTFAEKVSGTTPEGDKVATIQPPYSNMGLNFVYPINGFIGTGFGIRHYYAYPRLLAETESATYNFREEATAFTLPIAFGITPKLSFGASLIAHITEYMCQQPGQSVIDGNSLTSNFMVGSLFKLSERFRMGATYTSSDLYEKTQSVVGGISSRSERPSQHFFRIGTAMYPVRWFFFFGDLEYRKYDHFAQFQPGFHLGLQLTAYGRPAALRFLPQYGMIPLYMGYSHEPYDRVKHTQAKYFSFGSGYYLNNIYVQWAWRTNVQKNGERVVSLGSGDDRLMLHDYTFSAPLFFCVGFRF